MPDRRHVHADLVRSDLVRSPGFQSAFDQRTGNKRFQYPVVRPGRFAGPHHGHAGTQGRMPADWRIHRPRALDESPRQRLIMAFDGTRLQLPRQIGLRLQRLGDDHQATGILVESMYNACPRHLVELWDMVQQGIQQGTAPVTTARMNDQASGLVDDYQRLVFVDHLQWNVLRRRRFGALIRRFGNFNGLTTPQLVSGLDDRRAVHRHSSLTYPALQAAA